jgi:hypothetical protein
MDFCGVSHRAEVDDITSVLPTRSGIAVATVTILLRCCFRVAELHAGYEGKLANDEVLYMILEGAMMIFAVMALTIGHPGPVLGSIWHANEFKFGKSNKNLEQTTEKPANDTMA